MAYIDGFNEDDGKILVKRNYVNNILLKTGYNYGYTQLQIPVVEYASSFDEKVVGKSPWPEWNKKCMFNLEIENYFDSYAEKPKKVKAVLIPEGTISVTRWLGDRINNKCITFPIKLFYSLTCYRNELINSLSNNKTREFHQFGFEILGSSSIQSDCEILSIIFDSLENLGIDRKKIKVRINDISIFNKLCSESKISSKDIITLKELLDFLAECKAGKHSESFNESYNQVIVLLKKYHLDNEIFNKWNALLNNNSGTITNEIIKIFGNKYKREFEFLLEIQKNFNKHNDNIFIDLCVIRSHEYYTGISFEVDVIDKKCRYIEIAGGGRFDRLVSNFVESSKKISVPCTGFAFGFERVQNMLEEQNIFNHPKKLELEFNFQDEKNVLIPKDDTIIEYFKTLESAKKKGKNFNIKF